MFMHSAELRPPRHEAVQPAANSRVPDEIADFGLARSLTPGRSRRGAPVERLHHRLRRDAVVPRAEMRIQAADLRNLWSSTRTSG